MTESSPIKRFLSALLSGGMLALVRIIVGLIRVKYLALALGALGVGFLSQGNQFLLLGTTLGSLSMAIGMINGLTKAASDEKKQQILATSFSVQSILVTVLVFISLIFSKDLVALIFGPEAKPLFLIAVIFAIPFSVLASGYIEGIFFGYQRYDLYVRASIWGAILSLLTFIPFIYFWGLDGAFWAITMTSFLLFISFLIHAGRFKKYSEIFRIGINRSVLADLLKHSLTMMVVGAVTYITQLWIRQQVITRLGVITNGVLQVPLSFTSYYLPFITNGIWGYFHPSISKKGDTKRSREELASSLKLIVIMGSGIILLILTAREILVRAAYTAEFLESIKIIPIFLFGDLFYMIAFIIGVYFLAIGRLKVYLFGHIIYFGSICVLFLSMLESKGLSAYPYGYTTVNIVFVIGLLIWFGRSVDLRAARSTLAIICICGLFLLGQCVIVFDDSSGLTMRFILPLIFCISFGSQYKKFLRE